MDIEDYVRQEGRDELVRQVRSKIDELGIDYIDPGCGVPVVVDMGAYEYQFDPVDEVVLGDSNGDGVVNVKDLLALLLGWGPCDEGCCIADLNIDGIVDTADLLLLLANWG